MSVNMKICSAFAFFLLVTVQSTYSEILEASNDKIAPVELHHSCVTVTTGSQSHNQTPIILLHGMAGDMSNWKGIYEALAFKTGGRVCIADLRNHGESPWSNETSVAAMTEDTIHLMDFLKEEKAIIIGHSLGGKIAIHTALSYPDRIEKIVVEDIVPNNFPGQEGLQYFMTVLKLSMDSVPPGSDESQAKKIILDFMTETLKQSNMSIEAAAVEMSSIICTDGKCRWKMNFDAILRAMADDFDSFWTPSTGRYEGPALFIYGTESRFKVNEAEEEIRTLFPDAKLVGVKGADHVMHPFYPEFLEETLKFLKSS